MTGLRKKLMVALLAVQAAVCLSAGILFAVPVQTFAQTLFARADEVSLIQITGDDAFTYSDEAKEVVTGLSAVSLEQIGNKNFELVIPQNVKVIGANAFHGNAKLKQLHFAETAALEEIQSNAFSGCSNLGNFSLPSALTTDNSSLAIKSFAFEGCASLTNITISTYVKTIGENAFGNCTAVETINYNAVNCNPVTAASPFSGLNAAKEVKVHIGNGLNPITYIPAFLFNRTNVKEVTIDNVSLGETGFMNSIFAECKYLTKVEFKNSSIAVIGTGVFNGCTALTDINLGALSNLSNIGESAFYQCSSLYQIIIPQGVASIGKSAFQGCDRLVEIDNRSNLNILEGITNISNNGDSSAGHVFGTTVKHVYDSGSADGSYIKTVDNFILYEKSGTNAETLLIGYTGSETRLNLPNNIGYYKIYNRAFFNNTSIEEVSIPFFVTELNDFAFCGCSSLGKVTFAQSINVSKISTSVFEGCSSLTSIDIPVSVTRIDAQAFRGCTSLKKVNFAERGLTAIDTEAFLNCKGLEVIKIPVTVTAFGGGVFKGCDHLAEVYLPESLVSYGVNIFSDNADSERLLIAPSYTSYENYYSYGWSNNYGTLTYELPVYLVYGDYKSEGEETGDHHIDYKLYGLDYTYAKKDGVWLRTGGMPVQHGYSYSVWYGDSEFENTNATKISPDQFNAMIKDSHTSHISLYARYFDYTTLEFFLKEEGAVGHNNPCAALGAINSFKQDGATLTQDIIGDRFNVTISGYSPVTYGDEETPTQIKDAGTYTLRVNLNREKYGEWDAETARMYIEKNYYVAPIILDLDREVTLTDYINWGVVGGSNLSGTQTLYVYNGKTPYSKQQTNNELGTPVELTVNSSSLTYVSGGWTIGLVVASEYLTAITGYEVLDDISKVADDGKGVTATAAGIYTARATFISSNNYRFKYTTPADDPYGLKISETKTAEGYEYVVTKVWYIVTADASELIAREGGIYDMSVDRTYGGSFPKAPRLSSDVTSGMEDQLITFTLANEVIFGNRETVYSYRQYDEVINSSMPVGTYTLTIFVKEYAAANGNTVAGTGPDGIKWQFDVKECDIDDLLRKLAAENKISGTNDLWGGLYDNRSVKKSFEVKYATGIVQFASTDNVPVLKLEEKDIHNRQGIWKDKIYDDYYGKFKIEYNVETASGGIGSNNYYTAENYTNGPSNPGKYTVYFNVTANNYTNKIDITNETNRKQFYYTLYIKQYIDLATLSLGAITYTGKPVKFADTDIYKFVYLDGSSTDADTQKAFATFCRDGVRENYVKANSSVSVALMIRSTVSDYYGWENGTISIYGQGTVNEQTFAKLTFAIERADNRATTPLYLKDWEWGAETEFDIQWATYYGNSQTDYTFSLQSKKDATVVYYYKPTGTQLGFDKADAGEYTLIASCAGGEGYDWKVLRETRPLNILQSRVVLETNPYIESWKYGDYKDMYKAPVYEFAAGFSSLQGQVTSYIAKLADYNAYLGGTLAKDKMKAWLTVADMLDDNGEVPAGSYVYVYELPQSGNYAEWAHEIYFSVVQVKNYWEITPTVHDWVYGDYTTRDTSINSEPHFGNKNSVIYYYRFTGISGWVTEMPADWFDKNGELSVGRYEFRAFLQGNENYEDLDSYMFFNVTPAKNSWTEDGIPGVTSWSQGRWNLTENALTAQAKYGSVVFEVYSASDTERKNAYDITKLNSLGVGSYILVATVEGTNDYEKLVGEATFAVFEDSVGMTGIIAATIVFAVIAIGLAAAGVVLLIIRNKKIEEEFRKMIKSELRRK